MKNRPTRALLALALLTLATAALPAESGLRQSFDVALSAFQASLTQSTDGAIRNAAQESARRGAELLAYLDEAIATYEQGGDRSTAGQWRAAVEEAADTNEALARMHMAELPYAWSYTQVQNRATRRYAAAAQYLERLLARKDELQQAIDEVALRRRLYLDYFLIKDEPSYTAQLRALARLQQQRPGAAPTPLYTPITMREDGEEVSGAIEIEFDIRADGRVEHPRIVNSTYTEWGGDEFEFLLLFWFREFRFTPGIDGDKLVPVQAAHYRLEGTRRLTRVRRRTQ